MLDRLQQFFLPLWTVKKRIVEFFIGKTVQLLSNQTIVQQPLSRWSLLSRSCQTKTDKRIQILWVNVRNPVTYASLYFLAEGRQLNCHKGRSERGHFIEHTSQRPNIAFSSVRQISPNFRTGIVRRASLGAGKATFADLWNIQVSQSCLSLLTTQ